VLPREVGYAKPATLAEALELLASNDGARALAGGQTLVSVMKARAASPDALVDLNGLEELKGIDLGADGSLEIGSMTSYTEIMERSAPRSPTSRCATAARSAGTSAPTTRRITCHR
jgi:carbon-monoxide dehydrogenase medium subunit